MHVRFASNQSFPRITTRGGSARFLVAIRIWKETIQTCALDGFRRGAAGQHSAAHMRFFLVRACRQGAGDRSVRLFPWRVPVKSAVAKIVTTAFVFAMTTGPLHAQTRSWWP